MDCMYSAIGSQASKPWKRNYNSIAHDGAETPINRCDPIFSHVLNVPSRRERQRETEREPYLEVQLAESK